MSNDRNYNVSIGFNGILATAFIVLKLVGVISWSWWWVLSPIWIPWCIILVVILIVFIMARIEGR